MRARRRRPGMCVAGRVVSALTSAAVLRALSRHIGIDNGVRSDLLVHEIIGHFGGAAHERRLRQIVTELRLEGHHVCAHPLNGYFIAKTPEELDATCAFLYERALASLTQISRMKKVSLPDLRGQLHLPT